MSPPDGNVGSAISPRLAVAARLHGLAAKAETARKGSWHEADQAPDLLDAVAHAVDSDAEGRLLDWDLARLTYTRSQRAPRVAEAVGGDYYAAVVPLLDEAIGLLRGLR